MTCEARLRSEMVRSTPWWSNRRCKLRSSSLVLAVCLFDVVGVHIHAGTANPRFTECEQGCGCVDRRVNLALGSHVDSPDDLDQDWCTGEREDCKEEWAADGNLSTYWDQVDNQPSAYRLRLRLANASSTRPIAGLSIHGFRHHSYAPRGFQIACDLDVIKEVSEAVYIDNYLEVCFHPVTCAEVELFIVDWYGGSPAVRELQLFGLREDATKAHHSSEPAARGGVLLPEGVEGSRCGHLAGETLMCLGRGGSAEACGAARLAHWECIRDEMAHVRAGAGGHKGMNRLVSFRYGHVLFHPFDVYFAVAMELYGEWSELEVQLMRQYISQGDTVVEAGVHIGSVTVPLAQLAGMQGRLVGFEPQRVLFQLAAANVALNGLWNVQLYNAGAGNVSDASPSTPMVAYDPNALRNFGGARLGQRVQDEAVEMVRLMTVDELRLPGCDFIKIDVEGWEENVVLGALTTVSTFLPTIYFEDNEFGDRDPGSWPDCPRTMWHVDRLGYRCFHHVTPYFNPRNWRGETHDYFRTGDDPSVSFMILCLHPSRYPDPVPALRRLHCKTESQ